MENLANARGRGAQEFVHDGTNQKPRLNWSHLGLGLTIVLVVLSLAGWEWAARTNRISALWFPPPTFIAQTFEKMIQSGEIQVGLSATLWRVFMGFVFGGLAGLVL